MDWDIMKYETLELRRDGTTAYVYLDRQEVHNAMNEAMMTELTQCFKQLAEDESVRVIVLTGKGKSFSAGADLNWMGAMVDYSMGENVRDSRLLLDLFDAIYLCPKPVIGRINGHAFGGGLGLIAVCDITVSVPDAKFGFSEVNLGIIPAVISGFVANRLSPANMRRLFITGERFDPRHGKAIGLIDLVVPENELDDKIGFYIKILDSSAPRAVKEVKDLIEALKNLDEEKYRDHTVEKIAELRVSAEGQEGISAFLEKRKPSWRD